MLSGAGIGMLPIYYLGNDLRNGHLIPLLPEYAPEALGIHAIYLSRQHQPLALRLLVDFLAARFSGDPAPWDRHRKGCSAGARPPCGLKPA